MDDVVILDWTFSPPDFFEESIEIREKDYRITIENGKVEAQISADVYDATPIMRHELQEVVNHRFLSQQIFTHKQYKMTEGSMCKLHADGRRDVTVFARGGAVVCSAARADFVIKDKEGNVIADSRRERIERMSKVAALTETYRHKDHLLTSLLRSYDAAVNDPANELVHLYEIRDALSKRFSGEANAEAQLGVSSTAWSNFGRLADVEPLKQGRHRGKSAGSLRDATQAELEEARGFARSLIERYLACLQRNAQSKT